jgi:hypothetical protein
LLTLSLLPKPSGRTGHKKAQQAPEAVGAKTLTRHVAIGQAQAKAEPRPLAALGVHRFGRCQRPPTRGPFMKQRYNLPTKTFSRRFEMSCAADDYHVILALPLSFCKRRSRPYRITRLIRRGPRPASTFLPPAQGPRPRLSSLVWGLYRVLLLCRAAGLEPSMGSLHCNGGKMVPIVRIVLLSTPAPVRLPNEGGEDEGGNCRYRSWPASATLDWGI